jgi:hypothetical protein
MARNGVIGFVLVPGRRDALMLDAGSIRRGGERRQEPAGLVKSEQAGVKQQGEYAKPRHAPP